MLGVYVNGKCIRVLPQYNTYYTQALFYDLAGNNQNRISITTILRYISTRTISNTADSILGKLVQYKAFVNPYHKSYLLGRISDI